MAGFTNSLSQDELREKIKQIMDNINVHFRMQTNAKLLEKLPKEYVNKITKILISLDGTKGSQINGTVLM